MAFRQCEYACVIRAYASLQRDGGFASDILAIGMGS
jgi:hypothetical protein